MSSIAKVTEITAQSPDGFEHAIRTGVERLNKTIRNLQSVWIKDQEVVLDGGKIKNFRVTMKVTFLVED